MVLEPAPQCVELSAFRFLIRSSTIYICTLNPKMLSVGSLLGSLTLVVRWIYVYTRTNETRFYVKIKLNMRIIVTQKEDL
jgi:hypothetical protein